MSERGAQLKIVVVGHVDIDHNTLENGIKFTGAGSPAMFIDRVLRQLGGTEVRIIAPYGPDFLPYAEGTDIYPPQPNVPSTLVYGNDSSGVRRIQTVHNMENADPVEIDEVAAQILEAADIVFIAPLLGNFSPEYYAQIEGCTKRRGALRVLLPQGHFREFDSDGRVHPPETSKGFLNLGSILPYVDVMVTSDEDHPNMEALATYWVETNQDLISIVTLGEKGAVVYQNKTKIRVPTIAIPKEQVVDTVGCGDTFAAAFAYEYRQTRDIKSAVRFANAVAGQKLRFRADEIQIDVKKARADALDFKIQNKRQMV